MTTQPLAPDLLARSGELEAAGQIVAAIDLLSSAPPDDVDLDLLTELVALRARALGTMTPTSAIDTWPPRAADPFPDVVGEPPVVHRRDLDPEILAGAIVHHGSVIVRGLVSPADAARLADAVTSAFEARDAVASAPDGEPSPWYHPFEEGERHKLFGTKRFVRIIDSPLALYELLDVYREAGVIDLVTTHLGERPALSAHKCALRRLTAEPGERSLDYHQDGSFLGHGIRTVNIWLALTGCGGDADAPGLDVLPRRVDHILETGVDGAHLDWTVSESVVARAADGMAIVRPEFEPGDAMLFDELMVHRTGFSEGMTRERIAIESWFFAPSVYPDDHVPLLV